MKDQLPCSYCGLPTGIAAAVDREITEPDAFCCLGCRVASSIMHNGDESGVNRRALTRLGLAIFFTMNVMVFTMVLWTWNVHDLPEDSRIHAFREVLRYACLLFSGPVLILLGGPLVESSIDALWQRRFTTDVLLLMGVCAAFLYSVFSLVAGLPDVYFEVACMILVAVTFGKWLEATAKFKVTQALRSLRQLLPDEVRLADDRTEKTIPLEDVRPNDRLRVLAGERIPVDGYVEAGICTVDEQIITGESLPNSKNVGDVVYGGTLNLSGDLHLRAKTSADAGAIARLTKAVEEATASQCAAIRRADYLAALFVPVIVIACVLAFYANLNGGVQYALMSSLSVVLIACPCALGIATPLALWVAINTASQNGVLFRNGDAVVNLARVRSIAFDKTGTLTSGAMQLDYRSFASAVDSELVEKTAKTLAASSNHVLSKAIVAELETPRGDGWQLGLNCVEDRPGKGITAVLDGSPGSLLMLGSPQLARELEFHFEDRLLQDIEQHPECGVVCVGWEGQVQGVFLLGETLRTETKGVFSRLKRLKLELAIFSGDHRQRAAEMERVTGVRAVGQLLPEDKKKELKTLPRPVAMVGDGINDALALAVADVGIALDCGADVSRDAADVCLLGSTLQQLPDAILLAKAARKTVSRNLVWAVGYNVVGIGFAVAGMLNPIIAAIAMVGSSLFVLTNSLRLASFEFSTNPNGSNRAPGNEAKEETQSGVEFEHPDTHSIPLTSVSP